MQTIVSLSIGATSTLAVQHILKEGMPLLSRSEESITYLNPNNNQKVIEAFLFFKEVFTPLLTGFLTGGLSLWITHYLYIIKPEKQIKFKLYLSLLEIASSEKINPTLSGIADITEAGEGIFQNIYQLPTIIKAMEHNSKRMI